MIKFISMILCLLCAHVQAQDEYLENIDFKKTQKLLFAAQSNIASGTIYSKIYDEVCKLKALSGTDAKSLFLDLYFSACFLANQDINRQNPENLSDDSYTQMLKPLCSTGIDELSKLSSLELTGILSRVRGVFGEKGGFRRPELESSFSRLVTGRGRFPLKKASSDQAKQLMMDIYRYYNVTQPKGTSDSDPLWQEIVGERYLIMSNDLEKDTTKHSLGCFIIAYYASKSRQYRLGNDLMNIVSYLKNKVFISSGGKLQTIEPMLEDLASGYYNIIASQIEKQGSYDDPTLMDRFYETNLKQTTQNIARINYQISMFQQDDVIPCLRDPYYYDNVLCGFIRVPFAQEYYLGFFSDPHSLVPYDTWGKMKKRLGIFLADNSNIWLEINESLSKNPLRKGISSFLNWRLNEASFCREPVDDPRYCKEETEKQASEKRRLTQEARQLRENLSNLEEQERCSKHLKRKAKNRERYEEQKKKYEVTLTENLPLDKTQNDYTQEERELVELWKIIRGLQYILECPYALTAQCSPELNICEALDGTKFVTTSMTTDGQEKVYSKLKIDEILFVVKRLLAIFEKNNREKDSNEIKCLKVFSEIMDIKMGCLGDRQTVSSVNSDYWIGSDDPDN